MNTYLHVLIRLAALVCVLGGVFHIFAEVSDLFESLVTAKSMNVQYDLNYGTITVKFLVMELSTIFLIAIGVFVMFRAISVVSFLSGGS